MKKTLFISLAFLSLVFTSCLETTQEVNLKQDGSGTLVVKNDFSQAIGMAKTMGGTADLEKQGMEKMDTTFSLEQMAGEIPNLTDAERATVKKGTMAMKMDLEKELFVVEIALPFADANELAACNKLSAKLMSEALKSSMGEIAGQAGGDAPGNITTIDDYYIMSAEKGQLAKTLNKEMYAGVESDEGMKMLQQTAAMGLTMKSNYVINLPSPATEVTGKSAKLSDDKMKVTINVTIDDFFNDPSSLEYSVKY
ncbi:MAG: hypothetical protein JNM88_08330 [Chitinophagaceae bacterium]|nr:hypothetical protein [Chitinophagaceae bacterium]